MAREQSLSAEDRLRLHHRKSSKVFSDVVTLFFLMCSIAGVEADGLEAVLAASIVEGRMALFYLDLHLNALDKHLQYLLNY